jgi:hypothetical protein
MSTGETGTLLEHPAARRDAMKALAATGAALLATASLRDPGVARKNTKRKKRSSGGQTFAAVVRIGNNAQGEQTTSSLAPCEDGEQAIGGGFDMLPGSSALFSRPVPNGVDETPTGWEVGVGGPAHVAVKAYVICAPALDAGHARMKGNHSGNARKRARKHR